MSKVFAIYPIDKSSSTGFLNRINTFEKRILGKDWHCFKIHFSDKDHDDCLNASKGERFIFYMGHGGETKLCGSCASQGEQYVNALARDENADYYIKEVFIDANNIGTFKNHIFFCFSCNSNRNTAKSLGRIAIQKGVLAFVGFGDIPTDYIDTVPFSKQSIAIYKGIIVRVMKNALAIAIKSESNVYALVRIIQILTTQEIQQLLMTDADIRHKESIVKQLSDFKNGIRMFGDRYAKLC